jgi:hypothetical protein
VLEKYFNNAVIEMKHDRHYAKEKEGIANHHNLGEREKRKSLE